MANSFEIIANFAIPTGEDKKGNSRFNPEYQSKNGTTKRVNFILKPTKSESYFVDMMGYNPASKGKFPIKSKDNDFNDVEVKWDDRFDDEVVKNINFTRQYRTNIGGDIKTFITQVDMVDYLIENLPKLSKDTILKVTGEFKVNAYNGNYNPKYEIRNVWIANDEDKPKATARIELFYSKETVDFTREDERIIDITSYVNQYVNKEIGNKYFPLQTVFNGTKLDMSNEKHKKLWESRRGYLSPETDNFVKLMWNIKLFSGAEEVDFTEDMLTDAQREEIELGVAELDDFKPNTNVYGDNKTEFRLVKPELKRNYKSGFVDTELSADEFYEKLFREEEKTESINKIQEKVANEKSAETQPEDNSDDLF